MSSLMSPYPPTINSRVPVSYFLPHLTPPICIPFSLYVACLQRGHSPGALKTPSSVQEFAIKYCSLLCSWSHFVRLEGETSKFLASTCFPQTSPKSSTSKSAPVFYQTYCLSIYEEPVRNTSTTQRKEGSPSLDSIPYRLQHYHAPSVTTVFVFSLSLAYRLTFLLIYIRKRSFCITLSAPQAEFPSPSSFLTKPIQSNPCHGSPLSYLVCSSISATTALSRVMRQCFGLFPCTSISTSTEGCMSFPAFS